MKDVERLLRMPTMEDNYTHLQLLVLYGITSYKVIVNEMLITLAHTRREG
jgi:hypothetical protein